MTTDDDPKNAKHKGRTYSAIEQLERQTAAARAARGIISDNSAVRAIEQAERFNAMLGQPEFMAINSSLQRVREQMAPMSRQLEELQTAHRLFVESGTFARFTEIATEAYRASRAISEAMAPHRDLIEQMRRPLAESIAPLQGLFATRQAWAESLSSRLLSVQGEWAWRTNIEASVIGFAKLARLSDAAHMSTPFAPESRELFSEELGIESDVDDPDADQRDASALENGLDPTLIGYPGEAYSGVLLAVGFEFRLGKLPAPQPIGVQAEANPFNGRHIEILWGLERHLRDAVVLGLRNVAGPAWLKQRVPGDIKGRWLGKQQRDRDEQTDVYEPIEYADLGELADIILRKDNWEEVFKPIFKRREGLQESMARLQPIRRHLAHSRPLGKFDQLTLVAESTRLLRCLGIDAI